MSARSARRAVTLTELLVVIGAIVLLSAILLAALAAVRGTGEMTQSMNRMRQIGIWMRAYSTDHREIILPSQFDYSGNAFPGKVRSEDNPPQGEKHRGTWADILWTVHELGPVRKDAGVNVYTYRYDSPDRELYENVLGTDWEGNPLRAAAPNSRNTPGTDSSDVAKPYGEGAAEAGLPGFFAANDFFDSRTNGWWTTGQIRAPGRSMYLVDSVAGETIANAPEPFALELDPDAFGPEPPQVDYRYNDEFCLMLFLDGHVDPVNRFDGLDELEGDPSDPQAHGRGIRVRNLDRR